MFLQEERRDWLAKQTSRASLEISTLTQLEPLTLHVERERLLGTHLKTQSHLRPLTIKASEATASIVH